LESSKQQEARSKQQKCSHDFFEHEHDVEVVVEGPIEMKLLLEEQLAHLEVCLVAPTVVQAV